MAKLPIIEIREAPSEQARRLSAWLDEWEAEMRLRQADGAEMASERPGKGFGHVEAFGASRFRGQEYDEPIRAGQIRLLSARTVPQARRPLFVAVLSEWEDGLALVTPYGPFSEPASTGELLTGRQDSALRVLCLWNSHTLPHVAIAESWVVDDLTGTELADAWAAFEHITFGKALNSALAERVGPPICHPRDPRRQYQEEELKLLAPLARVALAWERNAIQMDAPRHRRYVCVLQRGGSNRVRQPFAPLASNSQEEDGGVSGGVSRSAEEPFALAAESGLAEQPPFERLVAEFPEISIQVVVEAARSGGTWLTFVTEDAEQASKLFGFKLGPATGRVEWQRTASGVKWRSEHEVDLPPQKARDLLANAEFELRECGSSEGAQIE